MSLLFSQLLEKTGLRLCGGDATITHFTTPELAEKDDLIFFIDKKYLKNPEWIRSKIWLIAKPLMNENLEHYMLQAGISYAITHEPKKDFITLLNVFFPRADLAPFIHPTALISTDCKIDPDVRIDAYTIIGENSSVGKKTHIHAHCYLGRYVQIGDHTVIYPNVTIYDQSVIGDRVIIHSGTVIGSDGFGYAKQDEQYLKIPHAGKVVIEDDVEIGSNCSIDRATLGETRIKRGTKLDNLIQIAHNVIIGENTVIAAQCGIAGSTVIGDSVTIAGQAGIVGHVQIGNRVMIGAQAGVIGSIEDGKIVSGYPAREHLYALKREAMISKIPDMIQQINELKSENK